MEFRKVFNTIPEQFDKYRPRYSEKMCIRDRYNEAHEKRGTNKQGDSVMEMITVTAKTVEAVSYTHLDVYKRQV